MYVSVYGIPLTKSHLVQYKQKVNKNNDIYSSACGFSTQDNHSLPLQVSHLCSITYRTREYAYAKYPNLDKPVTVYLRTSAYENRQTGEMKLEKRKKKKRRKRVDFYKQLRRTSWYPLHRAAELISYQEEEANPIPRSACKYDMCERSYLLDSRPRARVKSK